jgi:type I restriction enzyme R subunit
MTTNPYNEDPIVEQPAIQLFADLGWQTVSAWDETIGPGGALGRETRGEVVLVERLAAALVKFNPTLPPAAVEAAIDELTRDRSAMSLVAANREIYRLLKDGIPISMLDPMHGGQKTERLRVIDWEHPGT